jgi:aryl-alcohol dehydrogenase-like predicted oxidoreductase
MKIALGTVQFGIPYGINNIKGIPDRNEIKNIFRLAHDSGISILDTAPAYGDAEVKIGELSNSKFKVVTKFSYANNEIELRSQLSKSLQDLGTSNVYGYLSHNADNLLKVPELWRVLCEARDERLIKKIGYSLYNPDQLDMLLSNGHIPDLVQIPYSLLDRKFETALSIL